MNAYIRRIKKTLLHMIVPKYKVHCKHTDHLLAVALKNINPKGIHCKQMLLQVVTLLSTEFNEGRR